MQEFLKEWGPAVITAIAVIAIVGIVSLLKNSLKGMLQTLLDNVKDKSFTIIEEEAENPPGSEGWDM